MTDFAAVLWDLDGTIVDTEPLWFGAESALASRHGQVWTMEDALRLVGSDLLAAAEVIRAQLGIDTQPDVIVDFLVSSVVAGLEHDVPWRPGAVELIESLAAAGVPQALVTMSYQPIAAPFATRLPFDAVVTGDIVPRGKPFPDPYLMAAERLGVDPTQCLAIEDSPTGAASANAAGCFVVAVPHVVDVPEAPNRVRLTTLDGLTPVDLVRLRDA